MNDIELVCGYLSDNSSEVYAFLNYHWVSQRRLMEAIKSSFGTGGLRQDGFKQTEEEYTKVKDDFLVTVCAKCQTKRVNHIWTKLDVVSMAKKTIFGAFVIPGYYEPMMHAHSTVNAIITRLEETECDVIGFNPDAQPRHADRALMTAHNLILGVLETHKKFFGLEALEQPLQICYSDFVDIWKKDDS